MDFYTWISNPKNLVPRDFTVKLIDFGPVHQDKKQDNPSKLRNSPDAAYLSPKQLQAPARDERSDIFSFGVARMNWSRAQAGAWHLDPGVYRRT